MSKSAKVKQIVIQIGETELSLKPDEARELMNVLKELLEPAKDTTYVPYPYPVAPDYYRPWRYVGTYWTITNQPTTVTNGVSYSITASTSTDKS